MDNENGNDSFFTNVSQKISAQEHKALVNLFGIHATPYLQGETDGMLLDSDQKNKIKLTIQNEFHRQGKALISELSERILELESALEQKQIGLATIRSDIARLEASKGGGYHGRMKIWEAAENLRNIAQEENNLLKQLAEDHKNRVSVITQSFKTDNHIQELTNVDTTRDYKKITDIILQLGRFSEASGKINVFEGLKLLAQKRMLEILQTKLEYERKLYEQRVKEVKDDIQLRIDSIHAQVNELPSRQEMWFNTIITALIFIVEIPLHYIFTSKALELRADIYSLEVVLRSAFAVGLPLVLGLIFKHFFIDTEPSLKASEEIEKGKKTVRNRNFKFFFIAVLILFIVSIGLLNGINSSNIGQQARNKLLLNTLRFIVFSVTTFSLSFIGAVYFSKAKNCWVKRRVLRFNFKKEKQFADTLTSRRHEELKIEQQIVLIKKEIKKISLSISHSHENNITTRFMTILDAVIVQYDQGFERGWRKKISEIFDKREPIPLNSSLSIINKLSKS